MFGKVLVANRGEIAVRIVRALRDAGIRSVTVYSDADRASLAVQIADEAAGLGPAPSSESYLRIDKIIDAARRHGAEAIHPGYGFLSENADFAAACQAAGIVFIGPPADVIRQMGSKVAARQLAIASGAPVVPGTETSLRRLDQARDAARALGYPVMLKASAGGGGKGMRRVDREEDLEASIRDAASEAMRAFGNDDIYLEKLIVEPRHIEIQVLGDHHGNLIHLGERECSIQRRHQKVIEECPSPLMALHPDLRERMGQAALTVARAAGYTNAGTIEFLVDTHADAQTNFYFLEMNTRLQVEHPVTELVTGLDLVQWQLRIAAGERLTVRQQDVSWRGAAVECRVYAEDPDQQFLPSPGRITHLSEPSGPGVRIDSGVYTGWTVPIEYDPLLAKVTTWGTSREIAIARMARALEEYSVGGIKTNLSLFREILSDSRFAAGELSTGFLDGFFARRPSRPEMELEAEAAAVLVAATLIAARTSGSQPATDIPTRSEWLAIGRDELLR